MQVEAQLRSGNRKGLPLRWIPWEDHSNVALLGVQVDQGKRPDTRSVVDPRERAAHCDESAYSGLSGRVRPRGPPSTTTLVLPISSAKSCRFSGDHPVARVA